MKTRVAARHFELTPEIRDHAEESFASLEKYFDQIISCELTLDVEKHRKLAELQVKVHGQVLTATEQSDDMYVTIEGAFDKARTQLKKYKGKLKNKNPKRVAAIESVVTKPETDADAVDY